MGDDRDRLTVNLPNKLLEAVVQVVDEGYYMNRTEVVKDALRELLRDRLEAEGGPRPGFDVRPFNHDRRRR